MKNKVNLLVMMAILPCLIMGQGPEWVVFNATNSGLADNDLRSLSIDGNGVKWIGSVNDAVFTYDGSVWNHYYSGNSYVYDDYILCISTDAWNNKWIGTRSGGMSEYDGTQWFFWDEIHSDIPDDKVYDIQFEGSVKWVATMHGLAGFDGTNWITYNESNSGIPAEEVRGIAIDNQGNKWIATWGGGIAKFDGTNWTAYMKSNSPIPDDYCISIFYDGVNLWIGTSGNGLAKFDGTNWEVFKTSNSGIPSDFVFNTKKEGNKMWFATGAGLAMLDGTLWTVFNTTNSGLPGQIVKDIEVDASGNKWIATDQGLAEFRQGGVLGINDENAGYGPAADVTVSPNPVKTAATISWKNIAGNEVQFWLINSTGQVLSLKGNPAVNRLTADYTLDLSDLEPGIYFLKCQINNQLMTKKIIVN